jgi:hypothetical protein
MDFKESTGRSKRHYIVSLLKAMGKLGNKFRTFIIFTWDPLGTGHHYGVRSAKRATQLTSSKRGRKNKINDSHAG